MSLLVNLIDAVQRDSQTQIFGKTVTRPTLNVTDGTNTTYCCDVDIGVVTPQGYDQSQNLYQTQLNGTILHAVPLARGNADLIYADVGAPVTLQRDASGRYTIIGFSKIMPGSNIRVAVNLDDFTIGAIEDFTITVRALSYDELADYGGYGIVPYGAIATFRGSTLIGITS